MIPWRSDIESEDFGVAEIIRGEKRPHIVTAGGSIGSQAVVVDDIIYFGAFDSYVYALEAIKGKLLWDFRTGGIIHSTPLINKRNIYVGSCNNWLYALNEDGNEIWKFQTGNQILHSSPSIVKDVVLVGSHDHNLYGVSAKYGNEVLKFPAGGIIDTSPAVVNETIYFGSGNGNFYALNLKGEILWKYYCGSTPSTPIVVDDKGKEVWNERIKSFLSSSPKVRNGTIIFGTKTPATGVYALSLEGKLLWNFRLITNRSVVGYPTTFKDRVYFGSTDGYLYALSVKDGSLEWKFRTEDRIISSPLVFRGNVYFGSMDSNFYALSAEDGSLQWKFKTNSHITSSPIVNKDILYFGSWDTYFYALTLDGKEEWKFKTRHLNFPSEFIDARVVEVDATRAILAVEKIRPETKAYRPAILDFGVYRGPDTKYKFSTLYTKQVSYGEMFKSSSKSYLKKRGYGR